MKREDHSLATRIVSDPNICGGKPCIAGHRVRVSDIVSRHEYQGMTPDAIVSDIPSITLSDVHAALAYYHDNIDLIRQEMQREIDAIEGGQAATVLRTH